jgi:prepilin-type processing-associated H-X9-DG protein
VLVGKLLPALNKARRAAATMQCASNMRQIAGAVLMYINANKGKFPPSGSPAVPGVYAYAWWWPNELVRGKYINAAGVNVYSHPNSSTQERRFSSSNIFKCPECLDADDLAGGGGDFPADPKNNAYTILNDSPTTGAAAEGLGVPSWYMLNSRTALDSGGGAIGGMKLPGGTSAAPFVWYNSTTTAATLQDPGFQRNISCVHKPAELILLVEASNPNFYDPAVVIPNCYMRRLGARHGKKTADGRNAYTNFAFFDGHVGLFPTEPFQKQPQSGQASWTENIYRETIFFVKQQRGK